MYLNILQKPRQKIILLSEYKLLQRGKNYKAPVKKTSKKISSQNRLITRRHNRDSGSV